MSIFKTTWVILKVKKQSDNQFLYTVFFRDYGILTVQKRKKWKEKTLDIWYLINCEIITYQWKEIHTIGNIQIKGQFKYEWRTYKEIEIYLKLIQYIIIEVPVWIESKEIFSHLKYISENNEKFSYCQIVLFFLKIKILLWELNYLWNNVTIQKILLFLEKNKPETIIKLSWISEEILEELTPYII